MEEQTIDVAAEAILAAGEVITPAASGENNDKSQLASESVKTPETSRESEESSRAQERIRQLVEENKKLKESKVKESPTELDAFINSIEDVPSRNLLKKYGELLENRMERQFQPVVEDFNTTKFDKEYAQYADKFPMLSDHKEELRKAFLRNPAQSVKTMVGEILVEAETSRIKPIERTQSTPNRAKPVIDDASKEDLYALLESRPPLR